MMVHSPLSSLVGRIHFVHQYLYMDSYCLDLWHNVEVAFVE